MNLSPTAQATLLLTSYFTKVSSDDAKPLTNKEWGKFALWLKDKSILPADLLVSDPEPLLNGWHDPKVTTNRILQLLNRGHSLALAVEKWQRAGLWVVTRSDSEYPRRLKQRLKTDSPPVLFGCGNKALLNAGGLAVIGSRNASEPDLSYTQRLGYKVAESGGTIVSGGARGVDEAAMMGAMTEGGPVIGVMSDSLLKAATSAKWRQGLMNGNVVLVSPFYPEAGFNAGNAMARNKYIYCLADSSLVIHSGKKGGTLNGAEENLKKGWVPLWVKPTTDKDAANSDLVAKGGRWCVAEIQKLEISNLFSTKTNLNIPANQAEQVDLFSSSSQPGLFSETETVIENESVEKEELAESSKKEVEGIGSLEQDLTVDQKGLSPVDFYQLFLVELKRLTKTPTTIDTLIEQTGLHKSQLNDWLKRAVDEGSVKKLSRPIRYQVKE